MCELCNRREFFERCAAGMVLAASMPWSGAWAAEPPPRRSKPLKAKIGVLYMGDPGPADRGWNADAGQLKKIQTTLAQVERKLGNVELVSARAHNAKEVAAALDRLGPNVPLLVVNLNIFAMFRNIRPALDRGYPMAVFSLPASGHDWMYPPRWRERGHRVTLFATSNVQELETIVRLLRVIPLLRSTRILLFPPARGTAPARDPKQVKEKLGPEVLAIKQEVFDRILADVDEKATREEMERWKRGARQILEPKEEDIWKAARVSIALQRLMAEYDAQGLAVGTCMGWLARGFPCLGFARLRDKGIPAACEGDMDSLLTMLIYQYAFEKPGFQGNQTFDTSRNALWTAHCTAPLKMDGPEGKEAPYLLRSHSEIGGGCVPEVKFRLGQPITRTKLINLDTLLISKAQIIEVPPKAIHGCRSQLVSRVENAEQMVRNWSLAIPSEDPMTLLHRVVFYGDYLREARHLADLMGLRMIVEG